MFAAGHPLVARESVRKILVVKVDHIGDFVTAFPAFRRIKRHFPDAHLTVLAARASLALAAMEPAIDRVEEFNFYHARSERGRRVVGRRELDALRVRLAPERFDLAIDLRRQADTRVILQATGARWLAGFDRGYAYPWLDIAVEFEGDLALHHKSAHVTESLVGMVDAVSARCDINRAVIAAPPARVSARGRLVARLAEDADTAVLAARLADAQDTRVVCVHTGAGAVNKQWPAASFAALIDLLAGTGAVVVVIGGPDERAFAAGVLRMVRRRAAIASLVGRTSLRALPDILAGCDLYVGNDSGPKHIAASLGVPTIGIHGGSVDAGEWGAMGPRAPHHPPRHDMQPLLPGARRRLPPWSRLPGGHPPGRCLHRLRSAAGFGRGAVAGRRHGRAMSVAVRHLQTQTPTHAERTTGPQLQAASAPVLMTRWPPSNMTS